MGVYWNTRDAVWRVQLRNPHTKRLQHIGTYASEEDAARAYDYAAVEMHGPECTERNFPGELISERPVSLGDEMTERNTSRFIGVCWNEDREAWYVQLWNPHTKSTQYIGLYNSEEDAAMAYDHTLVQLHGPGYAKRNFPNEVVSKLLAARGRKR
ncbi:hypothetical protein FOA52_003483 [Chlamydomonas sp. UWO 241]|nr:hypothetical protein FOA52_003483 [Chlamydomonas sp. UWO 241]